VWLCVVGGIWLASLLALCQQRFVSPEARTVRQMAESCKTGQAANLIFGVSVGYRSTLAFATALGAVVYLSYEVADYWGVGFAAGERDPNETTSQLPRAKRILTLNYPYRAGVIRG
jgi:Na+/H+-translocating membrane pyrophosphatase